VGERARALPERRSRLRRRRSPSTRGEPPPTPALRSSLARVSGSLGRALSHFTESFDLARPSIPNFFFFLVAEKTARGSLGW